MTPKTLADYLDNLLQAQNFKDYAPNGLQVEGRQHIERVILGVSASQALIDAAISQKADAIIVHHGYFWKNENPVITDIKYQRLKKLLSHDINLYAYHLPLDAHPTLGNNAFLGGVLGITDAQAVDNSLLWTGYLQTDPQTLAEQIEKYLHRKPLWIDGGKTNIERVAWCTGAAQNMLAQAVAEGADAFISGEVSERTYHEAKEYGIHYFAAGHHATERGGVMQLADYLKTHTPLYATFVDIDNPV